MSEPMKNETQNTSRDAVSQLVREALQQQIGGAPAPAATGPPDTDAVVDESAKDVITESDVRNLAAGAKLMIRDGAILTPAAQDLIRERGIELRHRARRAASGKAGGSHRVVALGSDHGGFEAKEKLKGLLDELGYKHRDFGAFSEEAVDYPDFAHAVARAVADGACDLGIIVDGAGIANCQTKRGFVNAVEQSPFRKGSFHGLFSDSIVNNCHHFALAPCQRRAIARSARGQ
jgi:hypothetical protein